MKVTPPKYVMNVLEGLNSHGYEAYLVGGCVRDMILDIEPHDWDIASSARPEQVLSIFPDSLTIGMKHGTITVKQGKDLVEVTTFRLDGQYADHRHPESVSFVTDLSEDLSRRDFTINAIAVDKNYNIIDPFHGQDDIKGMTIRAVGVPDKRFEEDALRMFRAFRFSSRLGFGIENKTLLAIYRNAHLAVSLSSERIRDELTKVLLSSNPEYIHQIISCGLLDSYLIKRLDDNGSLSVISSLEDNSHVRYSMLCHILSEAGCTDSPKSFLQSLKMDNESIKCATEACQIIAMNRPSANADYKKLLSKYDLISVRAALQCIDVIESSNLSHTLDEVIAGGECCHIKDLCINGNDIMSLGFSGREIGYVMNTLLNHVIENPNDNKFEILMSEAILLKEK